MLKQISRNDNVFYHSLALRLAASVFKKYLIIALALTTFQLSVEYNSVAERTSDDLISIEKSFEPSLTKALWTMDRVMIHSLATGIASAPSVSGLSVTDEEGSILVYIGNIPITAEGRMWGDHLLTTPLRMTTKKGAQDLGFLSLYASTGSTLQQLRSSSIVIVINSLLRAFFLWLLFKWVFERRLSKPLSELTSMISRLELVANDASAQYSRVSYSHADELGRLIEAANALQLSLIVARKDRELLLRDLHDGLGAQIVAARLRMQDGDITSSEAAELLEDCMDELYAIVDVLSDPDANLEESLVNFRIRCIKRAPTITIKQTLKYPYGTLPGTDPRTVIQIIRILQEAFTNTIKHSGATIIGINVDVLDAKVHIDFDDNGCGIAESAIPGRGLNNMQRRCREIGGALIVSRLEQGTRVQLTIDLKSLSARSEQ